MNLRRFSIMAAAIIAAAACKKNNDTEIPPSLNGYLIIEGLPEYVEYGKPLDPLTVKGASHPDGGAITYTWKVTPSYPQGVPGKTYRYMPTDTIQTCTIYCTASAEGYSSLSASAHTSVVKGSKGTAINGISFPESPINGTGYYEVKLGEQTWLMNNLAEKTSSSLPYKSYEVMADIFGRYYSQDDAAAACQTLPGGSWVLPSKADWDTLEEYFKGEIAGTGTKSVAAYLMADATFIGETMWKYSPAMGEIPTPSTFSAIPAGYANLSAGSFDGLNKYAVFWTSDKDADNPALGVCKYIYMDKPEIFTSGKDPQSFGASVRCIKK